MINYRYDEKKYAEELLKNGFLTQYHRYELKILVKYFKEVLNKKARERKDLIYEFCENHIVNFNKVKYFKMINSALSYGSKKNNKLILIKSIPITDKEINYIQGLELDDVHKKILFTFIAKIKLNKEITKQIYGKSSEYNIFGGKKESYKEVFEMSRLSGEHNINTLVNELSNMGYIDVRTRGKINLKFIENIKVSKKDLIVFEITNFDNVGYYYEWYNRNEKYIKCENNSCGEVIKKTTSNRKYCEYCQKEKQKEWDKEYQKQKRRVANNPSNLTTMLL